MRRLLLLFLCSIAWGQVYHDAVKENANVFSQQNFFNLGTVQGPVLFSQLFLIPPVSGAVVVVSDGVPGPTCNGGGPGALAIYTNGAWNCGSSGGGGGSSLWSALLTPTGNLSLSLGTHVSTFTSGDYGASPINGITNYTTTSTSSLDTSYELNITIPPTSYHNPLYVGVDGFAQFQVCNTDGNQHVGIVVMGNAITCPNLTITPISKNWLLSQTSPHVVDTLLHTSTTYTGTVLQLESATTAGAGYDFARACSGASTLDGSCPSGNNQWRLHSDGSVFQNGGFNLGTTPPTCCNSIFGAIAFNESSTPGTPTAGQDYCRADSTNHQKMCSDNGGVEFPLQPLPNFTVGAGVMRWGVGDVGAQLTNAMAALPLTSGGPHCGTVSLLPSIYNFSTQIVKPRCVNIVGQGAMSTALSWTGSNSVCSIVVQDSVAGSTFPEGKIEGITLAGNGTGATCGIFYGGDPGNSISPIAASGNHQNLNGVRITGFANGVELGNNVFDWTLFQSTLYANTSAITVMPGYSNSGENMVIDDSSLNNNSSYAILMTTAGVCPVYCWLLKGSSFDFNGNGTIAPIQTGFVGQGSYFIGTGPIFDATTSTSPVTDHGSTFFTNNAAYFGKLYNSNSNSFFGTIFNDAVANPDLFNGPGCADLYSINLEASAVSLRGLRVVCGAFQATQLQVVNVTAAAQVSVESLLAPNIVSTQLTQRFNGTALSTNNSGEEDFVYAGGAGSATNYLSWHLYNNANKLTFDGSGNLVSSGSVKPGLGIVVSSLPSAAANPGLMIYVTDSTTVAAEGQTCAGSSSTKALAFSNGSIWKCF